MAAEAAVAVTTRAMAMAGEVVAAADVAPGGAGAPATVPSVALRIAAQPARPQPLS